MTRKGETSGTDLHVESDGHTVACFHYDHDTGVQAVVFFEPDISQGPLEYRLWKAQWPMEKKDRLKLVSDFDMYPKSELGVTSEGFRSVPWGRMLASAKATMGEDQLAKLQSFIPPTEAAVATLYKAGELLGFRNIRDLQAHAAELRLLKPYLNALYDDASPTAVEDASIAEGIDVGRARNLISRAKNHGYLDRTPEAPLGELTNEAIDLANRYWVAVGQAEGRANERR